MTDTPFIKKRLYNNTYFNLNTSYNLILRDHHRYVFFQNCSRARALQRDMSYLCSDYPFVEKLYRSWSIYYWVGAMRCLCKIYTIIDFSLPKYLLPPTYWFLPNMIFMMQGDKIHASISSSFVAPYEQRLKQGLWTKIHASISSSFVPS